MKNVNYEQTISNFKEYLKNSGHNTVAENLDCSSVKGFICESFLEERRFILKIRIEEKLQFAVIEAYAGINIPKAYRTMAAEYCNKHNDKRLVSSLCISAQGDVYTHVESFIDGSLSKEAIKEMESIAVVSLITCYDDVQQIARGVLIDKDDDEREPFAMPSRHHSEPMFDYENDSFRPYIPNSVSEMLKQLRDDEEDDEYNDEPDEETA